MEPADKPDAVIALLLEHQPESCLVFCNTKIDVKTLTDALCKRGVSALALHGDLEQRERDETLLQFANGSARVLVATDVAARGLDIKALPLVISYELAHDADIHVHRVGRTGRAGESGLALSLVASRETGRVARDRGDHRRADRLGEAAQSRPFAVHAGAGDEDPGDRCGPPGQVARGRHPRCADRRGRPAGGRRSARSMCSPRAPMSRSAARASTRRCSTLRNGRIKGRNFRVRGL